MKRWLRKESLTGTNGTTDCYALHVCWNFPPINRHRNYTRNFILSYQQTWLYHQYLTDITKRLHIINKLATQAEGQEYLNINIFSLLHGGVYLSVRVIYTIYSMRRVDSRSTRTVFTYSTDMLVHVHEYFDYGCSYGILPAPEKNRTFPVFDFSVCFTAPTDIRAFCYSDRISWIIFI